MAASVANVLRRSRTRYTAQTGNAAFDGLRRWHALLPSAREARAVVDSGGTGQAAPPLPTSGRIASAQCDKLTPPASARCRGPLSSCLSRRPATRCRIVRVLRSAFIFFSPSALRPSGRPGRRASRAFSIQKPREKKCTSAPSPCGARTALRAATPRRAAVRREASMVPRPSFFRVRARKEKKGKKSERAERLTVAEPRQNRGRTAAERRQSGDRGRNAAETRQNRGRGARDSRGMSCPRGYAGCAGAAWAGGASDAQAMQAKHDRPGRPRP